MDPNKKYTVINKLENDAPFGDINYVTISFFTPEKTDTIKNLSIYGFKVYNGYTNYETAVDDIKQIKSINNKHDIFVSQMGKIYQWDDASKSDSIEYENAKLNELEKVRKETADKKKLLDQQMKKENEINMKKQSNPRTAAVLKRLQKKIHEKGGLTKEEFERIDALTKSQVINEDNEASLRKIEAEINASMEKDYLDEYDSGALKYGCLTIYSPKHIGGLTDLCFKVRGLFDNMDDLIQRNEKLKKLNPHDRIYNFEVGKWSGFSENDSLGGEIILKRLNYGMKKYYEYLETENSEFERRKKEMMEKNKEESKERKESSEQNEIVKKKKNKKKNKKQIINSDEVPKNDSVFLTDNAEDNAVISELINYLFEPELHEKYAPKSEAERVEVTL